ncbi:ladderlectin [Cherax quadricarinatus]|nr:ladderlectin-like [Cherax quadricarinatus]
MGSCHQVVCLLLATALCRANVIVSPKESRCFEGFFQIGESCFQDVVHRRLSWNAARRECQAIGGDLASPLNVLVLQDELQRRHGPEMTFWVGASDVAEEGVWRWVTGRPVDSDIWAFDQPNNCCGGEDCALIGTSWHPPLNDNRCTNPRNFVCEVRAIPPEFN